MQEKTAEDVAADLLTKVLRSALDAYTAETSMTVGEVAEGCGNFFAKVLADSALRSGGTPATIDARLVHVSQDTLRVARNLIRYVQTRLRDGKS